MPRPSKPPASGADRLQAWFQISQSYLPSITHDGREILFVGDSTGLPQAWRTPATGGPVRPLRESRERVGRVEACPNQPRAVVAQDAGGNEVWQLELVSLTDDSGRSRASRRPITADPKVMHLPGPWMSDGHRYLFSSNERNPAFFDVYCFDVDAWSPPERIWTGDAWQEAVSTRGNRVLVQRNRTNLDSDLLLLDGGREPVHLNPHEREVTVSSSSVGSDGVYAGSNPDREFLGLLRYAFDGSGFDVVQDYGADVELVRVSPDGSHIATVVNRGGWSEVHIVQAATGRDQRLHLRPRGVITEIAWRRDGLGFAYDLGSTNGRDIYRFDFRTGRAVAVTRSASPPPRHLPDPRLHSIRSADGLTLPWWEYSPSRRSARGTIVAVHGGPESQARPDFDPGTSCLVAEGWRVIAPNVRGSTGYGRTYLHLDDVRKRMDSVRDLRDIAEAVVRSRKGTRGRLAVVGGSYGGFMVLAAITTYPELWGAAVELFGISNFVTFLERTADYRRSLREAEYGSLAHDREFLTSISPIHRLDRVRIPLLVFHGRNDPRVPIHEAEQIVERVRQTGQVAESVFFENEGHGFVRRENQIETARRTLEFLERYLAPPRPRKVRSPSRSARPRPVARRRK